MMMFLSIDFPPVLNRFLHGFRFSHYLFFPQIFNQEEKKYQYTQETPGQFGVVVADVGFLKNTGHDFLLIFGFIALVILIKIIDSITNFIKKRSNKVYNEPEAV